MRWTDDQRRRGCSSAHWNIRKKFPLCVGGAVRRAAGRQARPRGGVSLPPRRLAYLPPSPAAPRPVSGCRGCAVAVCVAAGLAA